MLELIAFDDPYKSLFLIPKTQEIFQSQNQQIFYTIFKDLLNLILINCAIKKYIKVITSCNIISILFMHCHQLHLCKHLFLSVVDSSLFMVFFHVYLYFSLHVDVIFFMLMLFSLCSYYCLHVHVIFTLPLLPSKLRLTIYDFFVIDNVD